MPRSWDDCVVDRSPRNLWHLHSSVHTTKSMSSKLTAPLLCVLLSVNQTTCNIAAGTSRHSLTKSLILLSYTIGQAEKRTVFQLFMMMWQGVPYIKLFSSSSGVRRILNITSFKYSFHTFSEALLQYCRIVPTVVWHKSKGEMENLNWWYFAEKELYIVASIKDQ